MLAAIGAVWLGGWAWQVVSRFADVLLLFFLSWLLAFVLTPVARWLRRLGLPHTLGVALVYLGLAATFVTIGLLIVPAVVSQTVQLANSLPALADDLQHRADEVHAALIARGLPEAQLSEVYRNAIARAEGIGTQALSNSLTVATTVVNGFLRATLVLILSFYIMLDGEKIGRAFVGLMPARYQEGASSALDQIDRTFGGFVRGQLIQALIYGFGTWFVMQVAGLPYGLVLSLLAGVAMVIPFIGPYLAMAPPIVLAVILTPGSVWWVFLLLFVLQFAVLNVLAPRIMSQSVGIHPLLVFAAVLIGAQVAGGWGAIFGVPVAAMLLLLARVFYQRVVLWLPLYRSGARLSVEAIAPLRTITTPAAGAAAPPPPPPVAPTVAPEPPESAPAGQLAPQAQVAPPTVAPSAR
jgi:predicted PurR-regulated permease PerM